MKDLIHISSSDSGLQLLEPMKQGGQEPPAPKFRLQKLWMFLRKFWWIPVITLTLSLGVAVVVFLRTAPIFYSVGSLWETEKLRLPDGAAFTEDRDRDLGTQEDVLRSKVLRDLTLAQMRASDSNSIILDENGDPLSVQIEVGSTPKSSVYVIQATSANPAFTPSYLNALMEQYLEYRKNIRSRVSSDTLASISEQVQRLERDMKLGQEALNEYERSNNLTVLIEESSQEAAYLAKLKTELSDYQLEYKLLAAKELERRRRTPERQQGYPVAQARPRPARQKFAPEPSQDDQVEPGHRAGATAHRSLSSAKPGTDHRHPRGAPDQN
jgi:uncharacterized protein involved in exopolysaccharide biosynthesis